MGTSASKPVDTRSEQEKHADQKKLIDAWQKDAPRFIDEQSRQQVEDYKQACNGGKGPMAACFATAQFIALYDMDYEGSNVLYRNVCYRPKTDKSPNGVMIDGTMSYPSGCFNLARNLLTGKGIETDLVEAYKVLDRSCRGNHSGACYVQAKILASRTDSAASETQYDIKKAMELYENNCFEHNDSFSCFALGGMLIRGEKVTKEATNVSPLEAQGLEPIQERENEKDRTNMHQTEEDKLAIPRDPPKAEKLLRHACDVSAHLPSCHNLAVMYKHGDVGVPSNEELAAKYMKITNSNIKNFGGFGNTPS